MILSKIRIIQFNLFTTHTAFVSSNPTEAKTELLVSLASNPVREIG